MKSEPILRVQFKSACIVQICLYCSNLRVLFKSACIVQICVYCSNLRVLFKSACIVQICVYCSNLRVLFKSACIVQICVYCSNLRVLFKSACIVQICVYCSNLRVLFKSACIVQICVYCSNLRVLFKSACIVQICVYCSNLRVLFKSACIVQICVYCSNLRVLFKSACIVQICVYCSNLCVLFKEHSHVYTVPHPPTFISVHDCRNVRGIIPPLCATLDLKWGWVGGWVLAPNFTEFVVVNAHGVFSACVAHDLNSKIVNHPKEWHRADGAYPSKKKTLSKCFGGQKWRTISCHHARLVRRSSCSGVYLSPVKRNPLQDFGPKMEVLGTVAYASRPRKFIPLHTLAAPYTIVLFLILC